MTGTPLDELRQPHPDQARIDADSAALLRISAAAAAPGDPDDLRDLIEDGEPPWRPARAAFDAAFDDFEDATADEDARDGWASDDCAYPD